MSPLLPAEIQEPNHPVSIPAERDVLQDTANLQVTD
jgi:hypothetical protein